MGSGKPCDSCEIYDVEEGTWTDGPPMHHRRWRAGATVANGTIFVAGGMDLTQVSSAVEFCVPTVNRRSVRNIFDLTTKGEQWTMIESMASPRTAFGLGFLGTRMYVVGGFNHGYDGSFLRQSTPCKRKTSSVGDCFWQETLRRRARRMIET